MWIKPKAVVLNDAQIEKIHGATLDMLEHTGIKMQHPKAAEILDGAGALVEKGAKHFEERLLEKTKQAMAYVPTALPPEVLRELDRLAKHWK